MMISIILNREAELHSKDQSTGAVELASTEGHRPNLTHQPTKDSRGGEFEIPHQLAGVQPCADPATQFGDRIETSS